MGQNDAAELQRSIKHLTSEHSSYQLVTLGTLFNQPREIPCTSNQSLQWLYDLQWLLHAI